ncbi:MAG: ABC transporter ATP-binding protein [Alphaproteobacteria bacterium]
MLKVSNLIYDYPGLRALNDVSFEVKPGTITALVGPNGAGKTTLLRCISALERPMAGTVTIDGEDAHRDPRHTHAVLGYLPDFFGLYETLTVSQCLRYRAAAQGLPARDQRAAVVRAAERMQLTDRMKQRAGALSRGLKQRLAIAQAIIHEPAFLLLDEPASGLDPEARIQLSFVLRQLSVDGMTLMVSSHILSELEDYATDMLVIRNGRAVDFRPLGDAHSRDGGPVRLNVALAHPDPRLGEVLSALPQVSAAAVEGRSASFAADPDLKNRAAILKALVDAGLPVCGFSTEKVGLRAAYMANADGGGGTGATP